MATLLVVSDLAALDLARPYEAAHAVSYGYDNSSAAGCTDYECGSICYSGHGGSDFPLSFGTDVLAGADGTVSAVNNSCDNYGYLGNTCGGRCGNYVQMTHPNGDRTIYCHMQRNTLTVSTGDSVSCGDVIGKSASSGSSTGPHLHLGWNPGGGASTDVYAGSCNSSPGAWRQQNSYGEAPGASCGCVPSTEVCDGTDNNCDGTVDSGDVCEVELLHQAPHAYTMPSTTDVTGNGIQDICARFYSGFRCFEPDGDGWSESASSSLLAEEDGWGSPQYYSTIRMGDVDGDGRADVCARHSQGFRCWRSTGDGFEKFDDLSSWSNDGSWDNPQYYTTMRLADINGNGRDDICARGASGWRCYLSTEEGFGERIDGPDWSNAEGYDRARYYGTIRVGDVDGSGRDDVCIRKPDGFGCYRFNGEEFESLTQSNLMIDDNGWGNIIYWPSIRLADIDGDGTMAFCARSASALFCYRFDGEEFSDRVELGGLSNDSGWSDPTNYATLRVGDVTGDGSDDLCIRANAGMRCYRVDGDDVTRWDGPEWSNGAGWDARASHGPLFITNIDGEERGALCGRSDEGLSCERYTDGDFDAYPRFNQFTDDGGWTARKFYSTIRMGQGHCRADWCDEEEDDPDEPDEPGDPSWDDGQTDTGSSDGDGDDVGALADAGSGAAAQQEDLSTSSCATTSTGGPGGLAWLLVASLLGLLWQRRSKLPFRKTACLAVAVVALGGCDRSDSTGENPVSQPAEATTPQAVEYAPGAIGSELEDHDVLAIYGDWRVLGDPIEVGERTDGPLRYEPMLFDGDELIDWPLDTEITSEVRIIGDDATLLALGIDGTLVAIQLSGDTSQRAESVVDDDISSQISVATDGCCIAYIRSGDDGQQLRARSLNDGLLYDIELGYSLGWAPAIAPQGARVAWTASPLGYASILVTDPDADEPHRIVNRDEGLSTEELDPFPEGIHPPVWLDEGIAFEGAAGLWLIDERGEFIGFADADGGMFWDEVHGELVDRNGAVINWLDEKRAD